jgi:signal transduction histidine kinase
MAVSTEHQAPPDRREPDQKAPGGSASPPTEISVAWYLLAALVAVGLSVTAIVIAATHDPTPDQIVGPLVVVLWALAGVALGVRRRSDRLGPIVLGGAVLGGVLAVAIALVDGGDLSGAPSDIAAGAVRIGGALLPAVFLHFLVALPDGRLTTGVRRRAVATGYAIALATGAGLCFDLDVVHTWPLVLLWAGAVGVGLYAANARYRQAGAIERRRMQWIGWGMAVAIEAGLVVVALRLLADWPHHASAVALALTGLVPLALIAGTRPRLVARVDRLLTHTVALAGLTALIVIIYVIIVVGLGRTPTGDERTLLLLSMGAAGIAALLYLPARRWLTERANRLVYGERVAPDETLRTFGQRLTRSIPMEELLLQLAESLRKSMILTSAELWTRQGGHFELAAGVPHRQPPPITIGAKDQAVVARAGVSGGTWLEIWIPQIVGPDGAAAMRVAPVAQAGELLGLIVVSRRRDGEAFTEADDLVLTELARQVALALHNVQLDAALQASLDELQMRNQELQQSRARIVSAGDAERRKLERNLHDGAQQHLVALAVKLRLARDAVEDDPADGAMIDEVKVDVQEAIQELRALAHGIFPPLLVSGGLAEALPAAATRAALPTGVDVEAPARYGNDVEAAVYFCVLEALQNAGKHAGNDATVGVRVWEAESELRFEVSDDGAGFDPSTSAGSGHGFINMADRLGAIGGVVRVVSAPGRGTTITGSLPLP